MADTSIDLENKTASQLVSSGLCSYYASDYCGATEALSRAIELMVKEHGDTHNSLGEVYLYYGKSLLEVSRQENEPLGDAVPKRIDSESSADDDEDEVVENLKNGSSKPENQEAKGEGSAAEVVTSTVNSEEAKKENDKTETDQKTNSKTDEANSVEKMDTEKNNDEDPQPSSSAGNAQANGENAEVEEEPTDLQLAWEILELAKVIFEKQEGDVSKKYLAETFIALGEVSMENENFEAAAADIEAGLAIQTTVLDKDSRQLAETHYKLGMALSNNNCFDKAIENFSLSRDILKAKVTSLTDSDEKQRSEIEDLLPEIEEKILDMKSTKEEALKAVASTVEALKPVTTSTFEASSSSSSKQATDISHLVKRKRKLEEDESSASNPPKKLPNP